MSCVFKSPSNLSKRKLLCENKSPQIWYQISLIWLLLGCNFRKLLPYLKSTPSNWRNINFSQDRLFSEGPGSISLYKVCKFQDRVQLTKWELWCFLTMCKKSPYLVFFGPYFHECGLNTEGYYVYLHIQSECGEKQTRKTSNTNPFHAVCSLISYDFI